MRQHVELCPWWDGVRRHVWAVWPAIAVTILVMWAIHLGGIK